MGTDDHRSLSAPLAGALVAGAAVGYLLPGLAGAWAALRGPLGIEDRTPGGRGCALTFDDGPHPEGTPGVLAILARAGVPATFFLVGEQVRRDPALAREIVDAGHEIGLHCDRHRNLLRLGPRQVHEDIARARESIEDATGRTPRLYRPPYGVLNAAALAIAHANGWRTVLWSDWGRDWETRASAASVARLLTEDVGEGSVLLLHDADDYGARGSHRRTLAALPLVLEELERRGLRLVGL
jgi:peptidoglycan/xylan/chitin deacetylase (PgdA/CDA1 family)